MVVSGFYLDSKDRRPRKENTQIVVSEKVSNTLTKYLKKQMEKELEMKRYTVQEIAEILGISRKTIQNM